MQLLKISEPNSKIDYFSLSLLSGWACPFADKCHSKVVIDDEGKRKLQDGKNMEFRCFSASQEQRYPATYELRKHNFDLLKACKTSAEMAELILASLPVNIKNNVFRLHVAGDLFSENYLKAWIEVANVRSDVIFYGYTKSIPYLVKYKNDMPENLRIVASKGGRYDDLIESEGLVSAQVVYSYEEAENLDLEIDHDDSLAVACDKSFALLIHGLQKSGSKASKAMAKLKKETGYTGYNKKNKKSKKETV